MRHVTLLLTLIFLMHQMFVYILSPSKDVNSSLYSVPSQVPLQISDDVDLLLRPWPPLIPNTITSSLTYIPIWNDNAAAVSESHIWNRPVDESSGGFMMSLPFLLPISSVQVPVHNNYGYFTKHRYQQFGSQIASVLLLLQFRMSLMGSSAPPLYL